jgi:phosphoribosylanthranilate isomerase
MPDAVSLWIKICGIRDVETAVRVADLGADAIGINFYADSPRCVPNLETAQAIANALPAPAIAVGVFVNHSVDEIRQIVQVTGLKAIQLHGDEPVETIGALQDLNVIRALRIAGDIQEVAAQEMADCARLNALPFAWLVDARTAEAYGGTGRRVDWQSLAPAERNDSWPPLILAGGLTPSNVAEAVDVVRPWGIDVASGVESEPGVKDLQRVRQFIDAARGRR